MGGIVTMARSIVSLTLIALFGVPTRAPAAESEAQASAFQPRFNSSDTMGLPEEK
jgi:hypothetical protein